MACTWISSEEVREASGRPTEEGETPWGGFYLELCTDAANEQCFRWREMNGYVDDATVPPSATVRLATIEYAKREFWAGVNGDSSAGFDGGAPLPSLANIRRNLGLRRSAAA